MAETFIDIMRTVFPVAAIVSESGQLARPDYFGTAFAIRPDLFVTAAHVVEAAVLAGTPTVGGPTTQDGPMGVAKIARYELLKNRDVALLFMEQALPVTPLQSWLANRVQVLTDLGSFGYPHAVTLAPDGSPRYEVVFRGYRGHVITTRGFERLSGSPAIYEMSCPYPGGLSGAPQLLNTGDQLIVTGVVLGSSTVTYGGVPERVGIAIVADELLDLYSDGLGGTLRHRGGLRLTTLDFSRGVSANLLTISTNSGSKPIKDPPDRPAGEVGGNAR